MAYGFRPRGRMSESDDTIQTFTVGATVVAIGDLVKLASNKVVAATTNATAAVVGVVVAPGNFTTLMSSLTINSSTVRVQVDADAVYAVDDANARKIGDKLDIAGTTGAMTIATDSNHDVVVVADSTATQETLVRIAATKHYLTA